MGSSFSCTGTNALDDRLEALFMRSISFDEDIADSTLRSFSFNGRDTEPSIFKAFNSGKLIIKGSLSFQGREMETEISIESPNCEKEKPRGLQKSRFSQLKVIIPEQPVIEDTPKHEAALKLQKVYKSFRTRRQLADCAVLVEQRWWKLLDFALLKHSSVSFFDIEKPETAVSRWSRARMRAAKVGKGLSKDEKARKLALQHWLEAIDPRHRYGHNLHFYYVSWLNCESKQPFFYWLDVGEGKEVNLEERCPRSKLQQQCIKYLGPKEREAYEVIVEDGKFYYKQDKKLIDTSENPNDTKWIFVLSTSKKLYVGQKKKGSFQHSSFLAGGATSAAGRLVVEKGILKAVWPHSGHYRPTVENFQEFMSFLKERNVDLTDVKESPTDDDEGSYSTSGLTSIDSELDLTISDIPASYGKEDQTSLISSGVTSSIAVPERTTSFAAKKHVVFGNWTAELNLDEHQTAEKSSNLEQCQHKQDVPKDKKKSEAAAAEADGKQLRASGIMAVNSEKESTTAQPFMFRKRNLFIEENEVDGEASVPKELILRRISSKKGMKSLQLGKQLSCKWTTGAGPRIGFVRDYPTELQFRSLEQVHLSPKIETPPRLNVSPGNIASPCPKTLASPLPPKHQK